MKKTKKKKKNEEKQRMKFQNVLFIFHFLHKNELRNEEMIHRPSGPFDNMQSWGSFNQIFTIPFYYLRSY